MQQLCFGESTARAGNLQEETSKPASETILRPLVPSPEAPASDASQISAEDNVQSTNGTVEKTCLRLVQCLVCEPPTVFQCFVCSNNSQLTVSREHTKLRIEEKKQGTEKGRNTGREGERKRGIKEGGREEAGRRRKSAERGGRERRMRW